MLESNSINKNEVRMRADLQNVLQQGGCISTRDAMELLNVSESTVRRVFCKMEADGEAIRVFGGIRLANTDNKYQYDLTMERQRRAKTQIGKLAASMVSDGDFIYIDCGTTTIYLCQFLVERIKHGDLTDLTVVANSFTHLEVLTPHCTAVMTGGTYYPERKSCAGALCESFLRQFHFQKAFLGVDGFSVEEGFSTADVETSHLTGVSATLADDTFVLMDSSKIGRRSFIVYDRFENIRKIITDSKIPEQTRQILLAKGLEMHIAEL